jgi:CRP/FNR family cyclic AMP-dependent transcriptional regulator
MKAAVRPLGHYVAMAPKHPWLDVLRAVPLFAPCTDEELERIDSLFSEAEVAEGHVLVREGTVGRQFIVIIEGQARVDRDGVEVNTLGPGDFVGEMSLLHNAPRGATVLADTKMKLYVANAGEFAALLTESPTIAAKIRRADEERQVSRY